MLRFYGGEGAGCVEHAWHRCRGPIIAVPNTFLTSPQLHLGRSFFTAQRRRHHHLWRPPHKITKALPCRWHFSILDDLFSRRSGGDTIICDASHTQNHEGFALSMALLHLGRSFFTAQRRRHHHLWHPSHTISKSFTWSQYFPILGCFLHAVVGPTICEALHPKARILGARYRGTAATVIPDKT